MKVAKRVEARERHGAPAFAALGLFIVVVVGCGFAIGYFNIPDGWYAGLSKTSFNPPNWVFAPVWSVVYVLIAIAGWRTWDNNPRSAASALWLLQMLLNYAWSPVFFTAHWIRGALAVIVALLVSVLAFIFASWRTDRVRALVFIPYAAWVVFASALNLGIVLLN